jgi:hypothetical protein
MKNNRCPNFIHCTKNNCTETAGNRAEGKYADSIGFNQTSGQQKKRMEAECTRIGRQDREKIFR